MDDTTDPKTGEHECGICTRTMSCELVSVCPKLHRCCKECIARIVDSAIEGGADVAPCPFCRTPVNVDASSVLCSYCHFHVSSIEASSDQNLCTFCATLPRTNVYEDAVRIAMYLQFFHEKGTALAGGLVVRGYERLVHQTPLTDFAFMALLQSLKYGIAQGSIGPTHFSPLMMAIYDLQTHFTLAQVNTLANLVSFDKGGPLDHAWQTCLAARCIEFLSVGHLRLTADFRNLLDRVRHDAHPLTPGSMALSTWEWSRVISHIHRQLKITM